MYILLLGAHGRLAWDLGNSLSPLGRVLHFGHRQADLTDPARLEKLISRTKPGIIVNAAAHTEVDRAETEPEAARLVNAEGPAHLARLAKNSSAWLVHYSTDYVFDGLKDGWYTENDPAAPLNVYGRTKLAGDEAILASGCRHLIFRTSWLFCSQSSNFPRSILELAHREKSFSVTDDQFGCPTGMEFLASATALALHRALNSEKDLSGLYNLVAAGETNWHGYAVYMIKKALAMGWNLKARPESIRPAPADASGRAAKRPANSRLSTAKFAAAFDLTPPPWTYHVDRLLWTWTSLKNQNIQTAASPPPRIIGRKALPSGNAPPNPRQR